MKRLLVICLLLVGCASDDPAPYQVNLHHLPKVEVQTMASKSNPEVNYEVYGITYKLKESCEIYMISKEEAEGFTFNFLNGDNTITILQGVLLYEWLLGHENRHCSEGSFH